MREYFETFRRVSLDDPTGYVGIRRMHSKQGMYLAQLNANRETPDKSAWTNSSRGI